jgi:hypothetical protein
MHESALSPARSLVPSGRRVTDEPSTASVRGPVYIHGINEA